MAAAKKATGRKNSNKNSKKNAPDETTGTRLELTLAAEKVLAINGLNGGTLRQIREEAGQKNESAIHYYFGSREAIIQSVLSLRSKPIDADRRAMLERARAEAGGAPLSTEQLVRCGLLPLARYVLDNESPGFYLRFLVQLHVERAAWLHFNSDYGVGTAQCLEAFFESKPYLPTALIEQRFLSMLFMHINGMAAMERIRSEKGEDFRRAEAWIRVEDIIAGSVAMYDAPLSPMTLKAIHEADELYGDLPAYTRIAVKR
ncbi:TetR family transcriptional regulator [Alloalcanivorax gelatiniphagus]|uniref:Helix-turn-helix transcriptional regulator n=1 Tax=Alloalcanivorax gelatiniphagus TaxID=1194167 RepID=A0ABY2XMF7_9GAMM|nr:TetR family transcriptional regulator [Alloalcanivorax gelatiniphagus]TMW13019.1 helix-turn-helix transcriptional regulator [Alloalcanivorax gelatiniphagus]